MDETRQLVDALKRCLKMRGLTYRSLAEGIGLILLSRVAGWLVLVESAFFVPVETYSLLRKFTPVVAVILVLNVAIVAYLYRNRERLFRH